MSKKRDEFLMALSQSGRGFYRGYTEGFKDGMEFGRSINANAVRKLARLNELGELAK